MNFIFLISYIMSSNKTSLFGGGEGTYFDQKCPAGEHISQFYGYTYFFPGHESIMGIGAKCSVVFLSALPPTEEKTLHTKRKSQSVFLQVDDLCILQWYSSLPERCERIVQLAIIWTDKEWDFLDQSL